MKLEPRKLDQKSLKALRPMGKIVEIWDAQVSGLVFRMYSGGAKTYSFVYRMGGRGSNSKWLKLGSFDSLPLVRARQRAIECRAKVNAGTDPRAEMEKKRAARLTIADVAKRFMSEYAPAKLKPNSVRAYEEVLRLYILPKLGKVPIADLGPAAVEEWHSGETRYKMQINRALAVLSSICTRAEKWGLIPRGSNPCSYVERNKSTPRKRDIKDGELTAVGQAARKLEKTCNPWAMGAIKVVALCAGRVMEVLRLRWNEGLFLDEGYAMIREHKTDGTAGAKRLELPPAAVETIRALPKMEGSPWVFPGTKDGGHLTKGCMYYNWVKVRNLAGVPDLRQHDFRSFAVSEGLDQDIAPQIAAKIIGHSSAKTTERHYLSVRDRKTAEAAKKISAKAARAFGLEQSQGEEKP